MSNFGPSAQLCTGISNTRWSIAVCVAYSRVYQTMTGNPSIEIIPQASASSEAGGMISIIPPVHPPPPKYKCGLGSFISFQSIL